MPDIKAPIGDAHIDFPCTPSIAHPTQLPSSKIQSPDAPHPDSSSHLSTSRHPDPIYVYDGSYNGFLCCVFESVYSRKMPFDIVTADNEPITLYDKCSIFTDTEKAERVLKSIPKKISYEALRLIETVFCSCMQQKELHMLRFLIRGYRVGARILKMLGDQDVAPLLKAERHLLSEAHLLKGFIRFADYGGALAGIITPKNYILPFIAKHFVQRYENEDFMIFDKTNKAALVYHNRRSEIISVESIEFPPVSHEEGRYQTLWKRFYDTVAIESRINPRCRMTHMPKRYWENMPEMQDQY